MGDWAVSWFREEYQEHWELFQVCPPALRPDEPPEELVLSLFGHPQLILPQDRFDWAPEKGHLYIEIAEPLSSFSPEVAAAARTEQEAAFMDDEADERRRLVTEGLFLLRPGIRRYYTGMYSACGPDIQFKVEGDTLHATYWLSLYRLMEDAERKLGIPEYPRTYRYLQEA